MRFIPPRPTPERIRHLFALSPDGRLVWQHRSHKRMPGTLIGSPAGFIDYLGFPVVRIDCWKWPLDAVAFVVEHGRWPVQGEHHAH